MKIDAIKILIISIIIILSTAIISIAEEDPNYVDAVNSYRHKHFAQAIESLDLVINNKPIPEAYYLKGYALYKLKRHAEAEKNFKEAFLIAPEFNVDEFIKKVYEKKKTKKKKKK